MVPGITHSAARQGSQTPGDERDHQGFVRLGRAHAERSRADRPRSEYPHADGDGDERETDHAQPDSRGSPSVAFNWLAYRPPDEDRRQPEQDHAGKEVLL